MSTLIQITKPTELIVNNTPIIGGVAGRVLFQGTGDVLQQSSSLFWDSTNNRLGIGTSTPSTTFAIGSGGINRVNLGLQAFEMYTPSSVRTVFLGYSSTSGQLIISSGGSNDVNFLGGGFKSISTGNFAIGSTTDAGFRLDVNGIGRFGVGAASSSVTIGQTAVNNGYIINATGYAASQYAYRFNNINGGVALFGGNNQTVIHRLDGGYQGSTTLQINGSSTVSGTSQLTSSILELNSTIQGFLPPRMTTTQKNAIASPATGLQVYDTTLNQMSYYNGTTWTNI
jgi:hypothetical protein